MATRTRIRFAGLKRPEDRRFVLFLDDGGVLSDNTLRRPQYVRMIGEFMPPKLGGTAEQWRSANMAIFPGVWTDIVKRLPEFGTHREFYRTYALSWMSRTCDLVGVALPQDEAVALYTELWVQMAAKATAAIDGAPDAVLALHRAGYKLYTASGTPSAELRGIVAKMGVAGTFTELYGPDVIDHVKYGPAFYERIFAHSGVDPARALVIESDEECCPWASEAGATAVWVDPDGRGDARTLAEVAQALI